MADDRPPLASFDTSKRPPLSSFATAPEAGGKPVSSEGQTREAGTSTFMDTLKSIPGAVVSGLTSFGSLSEQGRRGLLGIQDEAPAQTGPEAKAAIEKGVTGPLYKAQTPTGKVFEAGVETASNPISYVGAAAGPVRAAVSAFGAGAGGEVAGQITGDDPFARVAGSAVGALTGGTKGVARLPERPPPGQQAIFEAAEQAYDRIKDSKIKIPMDEMSVAAEGIRNKLNEKGMYRESMLAGDVFKATDKLTQALDAGHTTPAQVHSVARTLRDMAKRNVGNEKGYAAGLAREELFAYLKKYPELAEALEVGNANYRAAKTSEGLMLAKEKGQLGAQATMTGDNLDKALRTQLRQMYFNKKVLKTPEEKAILKAIVEGDTASNIAKKFNLLKTPLRHMATAIMHAKGAGIFTHAAQMLAKSISNRNTARQVDKLDEFVRGTAPAAKNYGTNPVPKEFQNVKLATPSGKTDVTGVWFLDGNKPVYANATESSATGLLGDRAKELARYPKLTGTNPDGAPITVWYKPGSERSAQRVVNAFSNPPRSGDTMAEIKYHTDMGMGLGYPKKSVDDYVRKRFGSPPAQVLGRGAQRATQAGRGAITGGRDEQKPNLYEQ